MSDPSQAQTPAPLSKAPPELSSILTQVQTLQTDRERLQRELEEARQKMDKLQEGKREEMKKVLDTVIAKWLQDSVQNEDVRKNFTDGMERLVKDTKAESGIWTVACEASHLHARKLEEIDRLRAECDSLKALNQGAFSSESSRKRGREDAGPAGGKDDFWGFEVDLTKTQWSK